MSSTPEWQKALKKKKKLNKTTTHKSSAGARDMTLTGIKGKRNLKKTGGPRNNSSDIAAQQYRLEHAKRSNGDGKSFTEALDEKSLEYFNEVCTRPFDEQAQFFLNAFWDEFSDHAECVYRIHWKTIMKTEMDSQGINYLHLYEQGIDLDFDIGLVLFESLYNYFTKTPEGKADAETFPLGVPQMQTSIKRKKELRDKVDVNFDGRVGFLEYLLYQFQASPKTLMDRSTRSSEGNPELDAARAALAEVNARIKAYEAEKARLTKIANKNDGKGVKALGARNTLAQIESGPLAEQLRAALITAEAKVRIVARQQKIRLAAYRSGEGGDEGGGGQPRTEGTVWWLEREILEKKKLYGPRGNAGGKKKN
jgi:hypothetical protein